MVIKNAEFICSSEKVSQCPKTEMAEIAFIGRSNVGKSSLINMLTERKGLAKVSSTPGKTRLINHFKINNEWFLVDLPGYGFARVSKRMRSGFSSLITNYIKKHEGLTFLFVLIDSRIEPQKIDIEFINFLGEEGVPFALIYTKADKLSANKIESSMAAMRRALRTTWDEFPDMIATSSQVKIGRDDVLNYIESIIE